LEENARIDCSVHCSTHILFSVFWIESLFKTKRVITSGKDAPPDLLKVSKGGYFTVDLFPDVLSTCSTEIPAHSLFVAPG
jgi:hypothetical protein